jgi:hypothetical protein
MRLLAAIEVAIGKIGMGQLEDNLLPLRFHIRAQRASEQIPCRKRMRKDGQRLHRIDDAQSCLVCANRQPLLADPMERLAEIRKVGLQRSGDGSLYS